MPIISTSTGGGAAAGTVGGLIEETRRLLFQNSKSEYNFLSGAHDSSTTTFTFSDALGGVTAGAYLAVGDEVVYVRSTSGSTATVVRGMLGTTKAAHADGSMVEVQPRWPKPFIRDALKDEIRTWPQDLFQVTHVDVTASSSYFSQGVDLGITGEWYYVLAVRHTPDAVTDSTSSLVYSKNWPAVRHFDIFRNAPTGDFASGTGIIINEKVPSGTVRVVYAKPFDISTFADDTDLAGDVGLDGAMFDIPPMGAAWRLLSGAETPRSDTRAQGVSRRANEVPELTAARQARGIKDLRDERLGEEVARLRARYPVRHT